MENKFDFFLFKEWTFYKKCQVFTDCPRIQIHRFNLLLSAVINALKLITIWFLTINLDFSEIPLIGSPRIKIYR